jgi:hypothetical protein
METWLDGPFNVCTNLHICLFIRNSTRCSLTKQLFVDSLRPEILFPSRPISGEGKTCLTYREENLQSVHSPPYLKQ